MMKPANKALAEELSAVADNLVFGEDGRISSFVWESDEKGEWSVYRLVLQNRVWNTPSLQVRNFQEFNEGFSERREESQALYEILKPHLEDFEFYVAYFPDEILCIYVGKTADGDWIGISSGFEIYSSASFVANFEVSESCRVKNVSPSQAALQILSNLEQIGFSEAKLPVWDIANRIEKKKYIYEVAQDKEKLIEKLLISVKFLVIQEFGEGIDVLGSQFYDPEDDPQRDYKELDRVLKSRLEGLRIYMVGLPSAGEFDIYVIGRTSTGDYAGVSIDVPLNP